MCIRDRRYFDTHKTGEVMSRVTNDLEKVSAAMQEGLPQFVSSVFTILFAAAVMLSLSPGLFLVVLLSLAVSMEMCIRDRSYSRSFSYILPEGRACSPAAQDLISILEVLGER